ncbi:phytosulfokines-like [Tripterygium wilfordii]|uniref:Phytosulfokine n=1 Tax=Tripterygium wilfordii TaxID=458696 RepID=A0A7J7CGQ9_TRIWF|nr:phytosulfokines-like [Tripterygium wilfordii]KAF5733226.1 phytosulfokines-like [Tripterygium wilfordii]
MSSIKVSSLCMIALLLFFFGITSTAGRPEPEFTDVTPMKIQHEENIDVEKVEVEESCEGIGEEECLMRRTLAAHIDYIYTQKHKP